MTRKFEPASNLEADKEKIGSKQLIVDVNKEGQISYQIGSELTVFELLAISENLYQQSKNGYLRYMESQIFGLIQLLREKKVIE